MIRLKVYYLEYPLFDASELSSKEYILVQKKSLLKSGLRAFSLIDPNSFINQDWYKRFLEGNLVEFYLEGSGMYRLVNFEINEGEFYFEKSLTPVFVKKSIFIDMPFDQHFQDGILRKLKQQFAPRIKIDTIAGFVNGKGTVKLDDSIFSEIRNSLIFIADITPVSLINEFDKKPKWISNSNVMLELGYALSKKNLSQIILTYDKSRVTGLGLPFDISTRLCRPYDSNDSNGYLELFDEITPILVKSGI